MKQLLLILFVTLSSLSFANAGAMASFPNPTNPEITIFPNPTSQFFQLSNDSAVESVVIYNLFGAKIKSFEHQIDARYNIMDMPNGMYLIQFLGDDRNVIATKRLSKR